MVTQLEVSQPWSAMISHMLAAEHAGWCLGVRFLA